MALANPNGLRQRKPSDSARPSDRANDVHVVNAREEKPRSNAARDEVVWGKTPSEEGVWYH